jgi:predicted O-methyltransferase YrrM
MIARRLTHRYHAWRSQYEIRRSCRAELARLQAVEHPLAPKLARAIGDTVDGRLARADAGLIRRIERLRHALSHSPDTIEHVDYGAGPWDAPRDRTEARGGVPVTLAVKGLALNTSKSRPWTDLIYNLVRNLRPNKCVEMGTCIGLSAAYQCAALAMNGKGVLVTLEGGAALARLARANLSSLGFSNFEIVVGPFQTTLKPTLDRERPVDFMFNDGHHDGEAMLAYFDATLPYLNESSVILVDDIALYESMRDAWKALIEHRAVDLAIDFGSLGLVCVNQDAMSRSCFSMRLR